MRHEIRTGPFSILALAALCLGLAACGGATDDTVSSPAAPTPPPPLLEGIDLDPPAAPGSLGPSWLAGDGPTALSWLERLEGGSHALRFAHLGEDGQWGPASTVAEGDGFFANWADFPKAARSPDGTLWAHWLAKTGADTYAYGIFLARSADDGATWEPAGLLHQDRSETEHGFVSYTRDGDALRVFWLDGHRMADDGPMTLRSALLGPDGPGDEIELDARVCECCGTAASTADGRPLVLYRGRDAEETRDIRRIVATGGASNTGPNTGPSAGLNTEWASATGVGEDGWIIPGCPVNGPAVAARGRTVVAAWYTGAPPEPRVRLAWSTDGGVTFGAPVDVAGAEALGRVDVVLTEPGAALVSGLVTVEGQGEIRLARLTESGELELLGVAARTGAGRASGFPRLHLRGDALLVSWVDTGESRAEDRVRVRRVEALAAPADAAD